MYDMQFVPFLNFSSPPSLSVFCETQKNFAQPFVRIWLNVFVNLGTGMENHGFWLTAFALLI